MSTPITPAVPAAPNSTLDRLLKILDAGLQSVAALTTGTPISGGATVADLLLQMGIHAKTAYEAETGQPYDLSKIPQEDLIPMPPIPPAAG
jgi:hypothetical protein